MKAIRSRITKAIPIGSYINCSDNTGAKILQVISVKGYKGVRRRRASAGVGDVVKVTVKEGDVKVRHQMFDAVIIRQKKEYRRKNGMRIAFEDNAAVLITEEGEPKGTEIKGPVAREAIERFSSLGKISTLVV